MKILFQGDSVTDAGRSREDPHLLGNGYPKYVAELLRQRWPDTTFEFLNYGVSGNRTRDLLERWQTDCIDPQPDVVSILIGINDTWRAFDQNDPTTVEQYESNYRSLMQQIKDHTDAKILMLEPFLIPADDVKANWRPDLDPKIHAARRLAREFADAYIPLDGLFAAACVNRDPAYWAADGVHPTAEGHLFIAGHYVDVMENCCNIGDTLCGIPLEL